MAHLVRSRRALELLLALEQRPEGARLAELARSGNMPLSAGQTGVGLLVAEGIAERTTGVRPHYRIRPEHPLREALLNVAARSLPPERAIQVVLGASPALEFAAQDSRGYILVRSPLAEPSQIVALKHGLERVRSGREKQLPVTAYDHDELRELLLDDPSPRGRAGRARVLRGSVERSFPRRRGRRRPGRSLGHPHPAVPRVSRRALAAVAKEHGLRRMAIFGSAVRSDFRSDSDVDVLVEPLPEARLSLLDLAAIEQRLERLFDRDVDVVTPGGLTPEMRARIEREAVPLRG